jgi:dethiobiotin synthetase
MTKPAVVLTGGDKGGVGKTTVARTLLDYFAHQQLGVRAFKFWRKLKPSHCLERQRRTGAAISNQALCAAKNPERSLSAWVLAVL